MRDALCVAALLLMPALVQASRLPIRTYTTADGLARDHILCIVQDSHGFLWFCTAEGLSRFDGYQFTNYRAEQGLPGHAIQDFLETRRGVYWVASNEGLFRFDPAGAGRSHFRRVPLMWKNIAAEPSELYEDRDGGVWCGAGANGEAALFYMAPGSNAFVPVDIGTIASPVAALVRDRLGTLWIGASNGLYRRGSDGATTYVTSKELADAFVMVLSEDRDGRIWVGTRKSLLRIDPVSDARQPLRIRTYTTRDGLPGPRVESLLQTSDGTLWVGTTEGLAEWTPRSPVNGKEFRGYTLAQGLSARTVGALEEDRDGNLWIGTFGSGAMKVARSGFVTYSDADGAPLVDQFIETRRGEWCAVYKTPEGVALGHFDGSRFTPVRPKWPDKITYFGWGRAQIALEDHTGEWWIATGQGLARFARVDRVEQLNGARPKAVYTTRDGLAGDNIFRIHEDVRGDIWIGTIGLGSQDGLARWDRATGTVRAYSSADGLPPKPAPTAFAEDRAGNLWVAFYPGELARYKNGRFTIFRTVAGVWSFLNTLFLDSAGRLWIGTGRGLVRVDDPTADQPNFTTYATAQGLSSDYVGGITEDRFGRIYAATGRGIDRFEPQAARPGWIKHYTTADGISAGELSLAMRDRNGALWFGTPLGVSRFIPAIDRPRVPPNVLVTGLGIAGIPHAISDLGQIAVTGLRLAQVPLRIDFVGLGFSPGEALRYQYMLEGADHDWSAPSDQRSVVYANLAPGSYRFQVRAVASEGALSPQPASVAFTVLPPLWRTWWFQLACATAALLIIYTLHRYRLAHLLAVANVRTRIATDLHDDIGASLSQIAILSEVAQRSANGASRNGKPLAEIAGISRELVDAMSDIVWAINPDHDHLSNLVHRMRRFAIDLLGGQHIALNFHSTVSDQDLRIGANLRRQFYLIFKEAIHNIARHSGARKVEVELDRVDHALLLRVTDDGKGFNPAAESTGLGLINMRKRAADLHGTLEIASIPGQGATLRVRIPLPSGKTLFTLMGK